MLLKPLASTYKTHQIALFRKMFLREAYPKTTLAKAWLHPRKSWAPLCKSYIRSWTTLLKKISEEMRS